MQIRVAVLTLAGLAGAVYVGGVLFFAQALAGRAALVAFAALAAYALTGRTRSAVPVALGVLAVGRQPAGTGPALADLTLGAWALLLATVTLAVAAALGRGWLFTAGAVLVALVALRFIDVALGQMPVPETTVAFLEPGMIAQAAPPVGRGRDGAEALAAAALFAGGLLAVLGLTRRSAPAVVLPEDPGDGVEA